MNKNKLKTWAEALRNVPEKNFNIDTWCDNPADMLDLQHTCGTAACAAGYLPLIFPDDWEWDYYGEPFTVGFSSKWKSQAGEYVVYGEPEESLEQYFGIDHSEEITCGSTYRDEMGRCFDKVTPNMAADRIMAIVNGTHVVTD